MFCLLLLDYFVTLRLLPTSGRLGSTVKKLVEERLEPLLKKDQGLDAISSTEGMGLHDEHCTKTFPTLSAFVLNSLVRQSPHSCLPMASELARHWAGITLRNVCITIST